MGASCTGKRVFRGSATLIATQQHSVLPLHTRAQFFLQTVVFFKFHLTLKNTALFFKVMEYSIQSAFNKQNEIYSETENSNHLKMQKPLFHFSCPAGWLNDPNGFSFFQGKIHLFYQWHPYSTKWGPMHWGHATTTDFINWNLELPALAPDSPADSEGCFSGTAIDMEDKHILAYTGVSKEKALYLQNQCIAIGNGEKYEKLSENPVITCRNLPFVYEQTDFRDPKIWNEDGIFYILCSVKKNNSESALVLFNSTDLKNWVYVSTFAENRNELGKIWECPDFFNLNGKDILIFSPTEMKPDAKNIFFNGNNSLYATGFLNRQSWTFTREHRKENESTAAQIDYGIDFYAPQTTRLPDGRRIMIAWMQSWNAYITPADYKWSGIMTFPREIEYKNEKLFQRPAREIKNIRTNRVAGSIMPGDQVDIRRLANRHFEISARVDIEDAEDGYIKLQLGKDNSGYIEIIYDAKESALTFDRSNTQNPGAISKRTIPVHPDEFGSISFNCLVDTCSIEIFVNGGEIAFTNAFFVEPAANGVSIQSKMKSIIFFDYYRLGDSKKQ